MNDTTRYRYLGITDECVECQRCGKTQLRSTVILGVLDAAGNVEEVTYYGSTCAAKVLGATARDVRVKARVAHRRTMLAAEDAREQLSLYDLPVDGVITTKMLVEAGCKYAPRHPRVCVDYDSTLEAVMDLVARCRRVLADAALIGV